jgi:phosphatidylserine/phosphatidylglycerophosphate/cardiolipin synthase-like enzyme
VPPAPEGPATVRVLRGFPDARDLRPLLRDAIDGARERIWIGTPYFVPPRSLRARLYRAARRGVDVRVVLPSRRHSHPLLYHAVRARYGRYLRRRLLLHEYDAAFYHAKVAVFDRSLAVVGSSNLDRLSWLHNSELDLAITDAETVDAMAALFLEDLGASRAVTREELRIRAVGARILERVALLFERWL